MYVSGRSSEGSVSPKLCDSGSQSGHLLTGYRSRGTKSSRPALSKTAATNLMELFKFK